MPGTELAKAYVQIIPSAKGIRRQVEDVLGKDLPPAGESGGKTLGQSLAGKLKAVIVAAGIGKFISSAILEGAKLEQSIGGIETLFKSSADKMKAYANQAYTTAGISANDYMEQATSFSASLLSSLHGDTAAAAEAANSAIIDMADNSNKMGTSLQDIQNAYQGFAKQNYTMLDNLKLGYGGTKTEMERLLADAEKLSGVKYDINNLSDVYSAIHVVQKELGITGTTSKEAATTLSGSFASMKAAATNFMGYLTLGEDIEPSLNALVETTSTFLFDNLLPAIGNIIIALPGAIGTFLTSAMPLLMENGLSLIQGISDGVATNIPTILANVLPMIVSFAETMRQNFGALISAGMDLIMNIAQGIADSLPTLIEYVPTIVSNIAGCINDNAPKILETGFNVIVTLVGGLIDAIPTIISNMPRIISAIWDTITAINWISLGSGIISKLKDGIVSIGSSIKEKVVEIGKKAFEGFKNIDWLNLGSKVISFIKNGIVGMGETIINQLISIGKNAFNGFKNIDWLNLGKNIIDGIVNGLKNAGSAVIDFLKDLASNALDSVLSFFGIHSPSRVFRDQVGKNLMLGMAVGIESNIPAVEDAMDTMNKETLDMADTDISWLGNMDVTPAENDSLFDYDRLIDGLYRALANITVVHESKINGKTLVSETIPLFNRALAKQSIKDRRNN